MTPTDPAHAMLLERLNWRYAVQKFDPARRIEPATWAVLERSLVLTPSGFGLQPWQFIVVTDPTIKSDLCACSFNQTQVRDASHVVVFTVRQQIDADHVDRHIDRMVELRAQQRQSHVRYRQSTIGYFERLTEDRQRDWAARQVYLALGAFMTAAALLGVDTCPMEGIDPARYDDRLGLADEGLSTVVVAAAGYRAGDDKYATLPKVRFPTEQVIRRL